MQGKKIDSEFVTQFIEKCIKKSIVTPLQIKTTALEEMKHIDNQIIKLDKLKDRRMKLTDVLETFKEQNIICEEEDEIIKLFQIKNINICKLICQSLIEKPLQKHIIFEKVVKINKIDKEMFNECIKELLTNKVLERYHRIYMKGKSFQLFFSTIFQENV